MSQVLITMKQVEEINLELLKMARELVMNEYVDTRAKLHNKWLVDSDFLWKTRKLRLSYPEIPAHPKEEDILLRAKNLTNFIHTNNTLLHAENTATKQSEIKQPTDDTIISSDLPHSVTDTNNNQTTIEPNTNIETNILHETPTTTNIETTFNDNLVWSQENTNVTYPEMKKEKDITDVTSKTQELNNLLKSNKDINEELIELSKKRLLTNIENQSTGASNVIPSLIKKIDEMKKNLYGK